MSENIGKTTSTIINSIQSSTGVNDPSFKHGWRSVKVVKSSMGVSEGSKRGDPVKVKTGTIPKELLDIMGKEVK